MVFANRLNLKTRLIWLATCLVLSWLPAAAQAGVASVKIDNARIRWLAGGLPLAGYFTLTNTGKDTVKLVGADGPAFRRIRLHHSMSENGMEKMVTVKAVSIKPGGTIKFAPGSYHLMMWRLEPLRPDQTTPVTLKFADGSTKTATFHVHGPATE